MRDLPSGTVTFLFTDLERSTQLLQELGDGYVEALAHHRRALRSAFARHGGVEVDTQGDAFFVAFARAADAVTAAAEAQEASEIAVRIGVHTGEPQLTEDGYVGLDVHRAARICSAAHGGQVVLSEGTRTLLNADLVLRDLGLHRLKDLVEPIHLFQLGGQQFPPLRSLNATNLPIEPSPLVGRGRELSELTALLRQGSRLLTLTGPGGAGKTRLALQVAAELVENFPDGVFWVPLAALRDPDLVLASVEQSLGIKTSLVEHVGERRMLILIDNFEQLLEAAAKLADVLAGCPRLQLIVTSRALLRVASEREYQVPPLPDEDAVALFRERAVRAEPEAAVAAICQRLDRLPLAIELAAARTRLLSPEELLTRLDQRLPLLTGGVRDAPERQRTLRATIEWSYDLLEPHEQVLFSRLSVFSGGFTVTDAEGISGADPDTLQSLVEKNLLRNEGDRLTMLETIREYALGCLDVREDRDDVRRRHCEHFVALAEAAESELRGPGQTAWLDRLDREHANIRAALTRAMNEGDLEATLRLAAGLDRFWDFRGHYSEGRRWLEQALAKESGASVTARAKATNVAAFLAWRQGDLDQAKVLAESAVDLCRKADDIGLLALSLNTLGNVLVLVGEVDRSDIVYTESEIHAREVGDLHTIATTTHNRGLVAMLATEYGEARVLLEESLGLARRVGAPDILVNALVDLAYLALHEDRHADAAALFRETLDTNQPLGWREIVVYCVLGLAAVAAADGDLVRGARLLGAAEATRDAIGLPWLEPYAKEIADQTEAELRTALGADPFAAAIGAGLAMNLDESTAYALVTV